MNPKRSINKKTTFNKNMVGGKRKKGSKKKSSKKKSSKKKNSKKKAPRKQVVRRVVSRPVFYNTYDPVYDYLSAARLGSSFNNISSIQQQNQALQQQNQTLQQEHQALRTYSDNMTNMTNRILRDPTAVSNSIRTTSNIGQYVDNNDPSKGFIAPPAPGEVTYGPGMYLQPNYDGYDMHANPSLDNMFHQEELMMNGGGFDF